jgi:hypothetical protein
MSDEPFYHYRWLPRCIRGNDRFSTVAADWLDNRFYEAEWAGTEADFNALRAALAADGIAFRSISRTLIVDPIVDLID